MTPVPAPVPVPPAASAEKFDGDLTLAGPVCEGRVLQVGGTLTVDGAVEAVQLSTGGALAVQGGIIGKQKGRYTVGGGVRCRFISGGTVLSRGDVVVDREILNCRLTCVGRLDVSAGVLCGGDTAANGGVACGTLGHAGGVPTLVEAGEGRALHLLTAAVTQQIEVNRQRVSAVRASTAPLLKVLKTLRHDQRERVTELLYEASELEATTDSMEAALAQRKRLLREQSAARIAVADVVHAGVVVRFRGIEAALTAPLKGPLVLEYRQSDGGAEIVTVDAADGSVCVLPSRPAEAAAAA